ncbi:tetratricopeptide repeat protein 25-like [Trichogramma pretiosum]|uniref:tetratricopeptide repeat protein 25-like n=1 Tax=Trichogramma pretiosum TaxID=7493 RepID=UPI000C71C2E5|nr:tetratricopeptide repeat protein 25-like [Trichogramma pretiosum]
MLKRKSRLSGLARGRGGRVATEHVLVKDEEPSGFVELSDPRQVVGEIEARHSDEQNKKKHKVSEKSRARALHREADQLYSKGDYESALVLYHRAAGLCPRDTEHKAAIQRTEASIKIAARLNRKIPRSIKDSRFSGQRAAALLCPEATAKRARSIVRQADDPIQEIPKILEFLDSQENYWPAGDSTGRASPRPIRSKSMLRQLDKCVKSTCRDLEAACEAGDSAGVRDLGDELINLLSLNEKPSALADRFGAFDLLIDKQLELKRHDRAVDLSAKMLFAARTRNDHEALIKALRAIGRIHLRFGHLDALLRLWLKLAPDLQSESIGSVWLYHDIGKCQFELGRYEEALDAAETCHEQAASKKNDKWQLRAKLLKGQCLLKLNELVEAVDTLKSAAKLADRLDDQATLDYVQQLIDRVAKTLRTMNERRRARLAPDVAAQDAVKIQPSDVITYQSHGQQEEEEEEEEEEEGSLPPIDPYIRVTKPPVTEDKSKKNAESCSDSEDDIKVMKLLEKARALSQSVTPILLAKPKIILDEAKFEALKIAEITDDQPQHVKSPQEPRQVAASATSRIEENASLSSSLQGKQGRQAGMRQERGARETNKITGDVGMEIGFHCKLIVLLLSSIVVVVVLNGLILVVPALAFGKEKLQYVQESNIR